MGVHVKRIQSLTRRTNSSSGNPRWIVEWTDGTSNMTRDDDDLNFHITNEEYRDVDLRVVIGVGGRIATAVPL